jgi:hypothetical protein
MSWISVEDFQHPAGWTGTPDGEARSRWYCEQLEAGEVLFFAGIPFDLPEADRERLLSLRQSDSRYHKNISYRPQQDLLRGFSSDSPEEVQQVHRIMRDYSAKVTAMLSRFLAPYAPHWTLDFASFRPLEEAGRQLPLHKRNDLLHVDAFPSRPTHGGRILRIFTNLNPTQPRVWLTGDRFESLAQHHAAQAGLSRIAAAGASPPHAVGHALASLKRAVGLRAVDRSPYDQFMLRFHDYLKESSDFQQNSVKTRLEFPPHSTWIVFTDAVPHAALSGQFALEQTYILPVSALLAPHQSPLRILETLCHQPLAS